jgi:hypothetical protein
MDIILSWKDKPAKVSKNVEKNSVESCINSILDISKNVEMRRSVGIKDSTPNSSFLWIAEIEFKRNFIEKIKYSDFEYGMLSELDEYLETFIDNDDPCCFKWIYDLYCDNYNDQEFIIKLLRTLAHIPAQKINSKSECIKIAQESIMRESLDIKENAVMAFENWEYTDAIPFLEKICFNDSFLDDYLQGVIQDLKELQHGVNDQKD